MLLRTWLFLIALLIYPGLGTAQTYTNVAHQLNVKLKHQSPSALSAGLSCVDFNGDGLDDITVATPYFDSIYFFENTGNGFKHIKALINYTSYGTHVIWVDYDNDGDKDLYVSSIEVACRLYRNDSTLGFTNVTSTAGLSAPVAHCYGATWGDINNDGWLDLYQSIRNGENRMYLSDQQGGFVDISDSSGACNYNRFALCPVFADFNKDGLTDLFVGNDKLTHPELYINQGDSSFTEITATANMQVIIDAMTATAGDFDNDGWLDIYITNSPPYTNYLFRNNGNNSFADYTDSMGVALFRQTWSASFFDYNNDGLKDLYISEKHIVSSGNVSQSLYENDGRVFFSPNAGFAGDTLRSHSHALGDFNGDGFYEIVSPNQRPDSLQLWQSSGGAGHWIKVHLQGQVSNRDAIGSWIIVNTDSARQTYYTTCGDGYLSQSSNTKIIGLGSDSLVDSLEIVWPSGFREVFYNLPGNQSYQITEGQSITAALNPRGDTVFCEYDSIHVNLQCSGTFAHYLWNTGDTTAHLTIQGPGTYHAEVWNSFGIKARTDTFRVSVDSMRLQTTVQHDSMNQGLGWAKVQVLGGTPPFTFKWNDPQQQSDSIATDLPQGSYTVIVTDSLGCSDTATVTILNPLAGEELKAAWQVLPNPADRYLEIWVADARPLKFKIFSLEGKELQSGLLAGHYQIDLSALPNGIYTLWLKADGLPAHRQKLMIKH